MDLSLDKRSTLILDELVHAQDYIFVEDLTKKLNVSRRTVYYDLDKINAWLADQNLEAVKRSYSKGLYLSEQTKAKIPSSIHPMDQNQYFFIKEERMAIIATELILNRKTIHLKDLIDKTDVSRITIYKDLNVLKDEFKRYDLTVSYSKTRGYHIEGLEKNKRKALSGYLSRLMATQNWDQLAKRIELGLNPPASFDKNGVTGTITSLILESEKELEVHLTDEMVETLTLSVFISCKRLEEGKFIQVDELEKSVLRSTPEFQVAERLAERIQKSQHTVDFNEDEVCFLTMQLLGSRVSEMQADYRPNKEMTALKQVISSMVLDFQRYACIYFENQEDLERLLFVHLKPAYYRIKYDAYIENTLTEKIKEQYRDVFQLTKKVMPHLEGLLNKEISDQETAYIATYFGGWMKRQGSKPVMRHKAMIVCGTGIGTSILLKTQLEQLLSTVDITGTLSIREYENNHFDADLFFTTVPLNQNKKLVITVNPILTNEDKRTVLLKMKALDGNAGKPDPLLASLLDAVHKHAEVKDERSLVKDIKALLQPEQVNPIERRKPMLYELLTKDMIQIQSKAKDWQEAIRTAAQPLLEKNCITEAYVEAMIDNVNELGPYIVIVPNIAIPHARPEQGVNELGMSMLCLKEPVQFSPQEKHHVQMVIVLAAIDSEAHIRALSQLTTFLSDTEKIDQVLKAESAAEIANLIENVKEEQKTTRGDN